MTPLPCVQTLLTWLKLSTQETGVCWTMKQDFCPPPVNIPLFSLKELIIDILRLCRHDVKFLRAKAARDVR